MLLFGGLDEARKAVGSLWCYDEGAWSVVETQDGPAPGPVMYAAAATQTFAAREEFVVFGGWDPGAKGSGGSFSDEVWSLNTGTKEWLQDDPIWLQRCPIWSSRGHTNYV